MARDTKSFFLNIFASDKTKLAFQSLKRSLADADKSVKSFGKGFSGIGAGLSFIGAIAGLSRLVTSTVDAAYNLAQLSESTGESVETLSKLQYAAKLSGVTTEDFSKSLNKLATNLELAKAGTGDAANAFAALKIDPRSIGGVGDAVSKLSEKFKNLRNDSAKGAALSKLLGEEMGPRTAAFFNLGQEAIKEYGEELERLHGVITEDMKNAAIRFEENMSRMGAAADGVKFTIAGPLISSLADSADAFASTASQVDASSGAWEALGFALKLVVAAFDLVIVGAGATIKTMGALEAIVVQLATLDLSGARRTLRELGKDFATTLGNQEEFFKKLFANEQKARRKRNEGKGRTGGLGSADALAKAQAEAAFKRLEEEIKDEQQLLSDRLQQLQYYYGKGFLSIEENYQRQRDVIADSLKVQTAAVDKEIKLQQDLAKSLAKPEDREKAAAKAEELTRRRAALEQEAAKKTTKSFQDQADEAEKFNEELERLNVQFLQLQGKGGEAFRLQFDIDRKGLVQKLNEAHDYVALEQLTIMREVGGAEADISALQAEATKTLDELQAREDRLNLSRKTGALSELGLLAQVSDARRQSIPELQATADKIRAIADATNDPSGKLKKLADNMDLQVERMRADADLLGEKFNTIFVDNIADGLADVVTHTKSLSEAWDDMVKNITNSITRLATQDIAQSLFGTLFKVDPKTGGGGIQNFVKDAGAFFSSLFASSKGSAFTASGLARYATGGIVTRATPFAFAGGGLGIMGEAGPEAILPLRRTREGKLGVQVAGRGTSVVNHFTIAGPMDQRTQLQIAAAAGDGMARALRRQR